MLIIVTGAIGVGKTTVCRKLTKIVRNQGITCGGILTYKAAGDSIVIEDIQSGDKATLASTSNEYDGPRTSKYFFNRDGIEFGIQSIDKGALKEILVVDEIGRLELGEEGFTNVLRLLQGGKVQNCILVIRLDLLPYFKSELGDIRLVFEITVKNRDRLAQEIASILFETLRWKMPHFA